MSVHLCSRPEIRADERTIGTHLNKVNSRFIQFQLSYFLIKNATFRQTRVFTEVAKHLRFARAAEELHLTPPAATMQLKELEGHQVDFAIMGGPPKELATRAEPFAAHPHVFVAPTDHPLLKVGHPTVDNLRPYGFILRVVMEMSNNETIKQAVMAGMGISFLSLHTIGLELEHALMATLDVEGTPTVRAWNVVHTLFKLLSPAAEAFRHFMLERAEGHLAEKCGRLLRLQPTA